jgi:hypothetical protein
MKRSDIFGDDLAEGSEPVTDRKMGKRHDVKACCGVLGKTDKAVFHTPAHPPIFPLVSLR